MCGFVGVVKCDELNSEDILNFKTSLGIIKRRGPDATSFWNNNRVFLGHNRLSIIDISDRSLQPLFSDCGRFAIIFNGEIYNYQELIKAHLKHSFPHIDFSGDTITLLYMFKKYGELCLQFLNGMFAFAIIDLQKQTLFLARDRFGEKPLYYYFNKGNLFFGSEIKIFESLKLKLNIDIKSINYFSHLGSIPDPYTIYEDVRMLEPASFIEIKYKTEISIITKGYYWSLLHTFKETGNKNYNLAEVNEAVQEQIVSSVRSRLVSDVEVGLFLSGGLDSASLLSTLKHLNRDIKCITCDFENPTYSEIERTKITASYFGYPLISHKITPVSMNEAIPSFLNSMDQPTVDGLNNYFVASFAKEHNIKVWLTGTGGDEIFGGYNSFYNIGKRIKLAKLNKFFKFNAIKLNKLFPWPKHDRLLYLLFHKHDTASKAYLTFRSALPPNASILRNNFINNEYIDLSFEYDPFSTVDIDDFQKASFFECKYYLENQLLRDADIFSMRHSIELRAPFLDHKLYDLIFPISQQRKVDGNGQLKPMLVNNLYNKLPQKVAVQKKTGFGLPHKEYLHNHSEEVLQIITDKSISIWDQRIIEKSFKRFKAGKLNPDVIWMVYILNKWLMSRNVSL